MTRVALIAVLATGCSWAFSRPPQRSAPRSYFSAPVCRPNYAPPVLDTSQAIGGGVLALWALSHASNDMYASEADTFGLLGAVLAVQTALYAASAHYGFKQARACREQLTHAPMWIAPSPPPPPPPPPIEVEVEQHVDVDDNQIDIHTTIRTVPPPQ